MPYSMPYFNCGARDMNKQTILKSVLYNRTEPTTEDNTDQYKFKREGTSPGYIWWLFWARWNSWFSSL